MNLDDLKKPFKLKWRIQSVKGESAICVAYIDARQVQERFDEVCGPEGWQNTYDPETGAASIGVYLNNDWIWKTDVGTESAQDAKKGKASDAFKRAAVLWGVGRDIYKRGVKVLPAEGKNATTEQGKKLWTGNQLSDYINGLSEGKALLMQIWKLYPKLQTNEDFKNSVSTLKNLM